MMVVSSSCSEFKIPTSMEASLREIRLGVEKTLVLIFLNRTILKILVYQELTLIST